MVYLPSMPLTRHGIPQLILFGSWLAMLAALLWQRMEADGRLGG